MKVMTKKREKKTTQNHFPREHFNRHASSRHNVLSHSVTDCHHLGNACKPTMRGNMQVNQSLLTLVPLSLGMQPLDKPSASPSFHPARGHSHNTPNPQAAIHPTLAGRRGGKKTKSCRGSPQPARGPKCRVRLHPGIC